MYSFKTFKTAIEWQICKWKEKQSVKGSLWIKIITLVKKLLKCFYLNKLSFPPICVLPDARSFIKTDSISIWHRGLVSFPMSDKHPKVHQWNSQLKCCGTKDFGHPNNCPSNYQFSRSSMHFLRILVLLRATICQTQPRSFYLAYKLCKKAPTLKTKTVLRSKKKINKTLLFTIARNLQVSKPAVMPVLGSFELS